jgi:hypothetical protein
LPNQQLKTKASNLRTSQHEENAMFKLPPTCQPDPVCTIVKIIIDIIKR